MEEYPLISEYIEAIKAAEDNFEQLKHLRPVFDKDGNPVMSGGNFAVVFKMKDEQMGNYYAVKCFLRAQEGRADAYRMIVEELESVNSKFLTPIKYLDKELFVYTRQTTETEFPVLLMEWVEGMTLDKYVRMYLYDQYKLSLLAYQFSKLAMWLMPQSFAHGDLKPDNILVRKDGNLVLVDYDGMFVPAMKGQKAREIGSPDFRHPMRTESDFNEHIDDFSLASILLSLKAISLQPELLNEYGAVDRLLLSENDYRNISQSNLLNYLFPSDNSELNIMLGLFAIALEKGNLTDVSFKLFEIASPELPEITGHEIEDYPTEFTKQDFENGWTDEFGAQYSSDSKYLFRGPTPNCSSYTIRGGTIVVCNIAFLRNKVLTAVHMPDSVVKIGEWAFHSCINLCDVNISRNLQKIEDSTFKYCRSLTRIILPGSVSVIGDNAFFECSNLLSISIPQSVLELGYQAFAGCRKIEEVIIPCSVKSIGTYAFASCTSLKSISILGAPKIGDAIFYDCPSLKTIYIPSWTKRTIEDYLGEYYHLLDRTRDYPFVNSWSLREFISIHGEMRIEESEDEMTGEVFKLCIFINTNGEKIFARDYYYWGGEDITKLTGKEETFRIGEDTYGGYNLYDKTLDYWESGMIMEWDYD